MRRSSQRAGALDEGKGIVYGAARSQLLDAAPAGAVLGRLDRRDQVAAQLQPQGNRLRQRRMVGAQRKGDGARASVLLIGPVPANRAARPTFTARLLASAQGEYSMVGGAAQQAGAGSARQRVRPLDMPRWQCIQSTRVNTTRQCSVKTGCDQDE